MSTHLFTSLVRYEVQTMAFMHGTEIRSRENQVPSMKPAVVPRPRPMHTKIILFRATEMGHTYYSEADQPSHVAGHTFIFEDDLQLVYDERLIRQITNFQLTSRQKIEKVLPDRPT